MVWIIVIAVVALILLLAIGGALANRRRRVAQGDAFRERLAAVNTELARAHAEDKGWERSELERAARAAFTAEHPDSEVEELILTQVIDRPGVDDDQAVFTVRAGGREHGLLLGRSSAGDWRSERIA